VVRKLYQENDKIMVLATGEVFTVLADLTGEVKPGIYVKEKVMAPLLHCEVRPAGRTRERVDAGTGVTEPENPPPRPDSSII
jgi:hypothetical protein